MPNAVVLFFLGLVLLCAIGGVIALFVFGKRAPRLNVEQFQTRWLAIENSVVRDNEAAWQVAIVNADKLVDQALRDTHTTGSTMGERMKSAQKRWSNANHLWGAHKIRNQLAHEVDVTLTYDMTRRALAAYKQGLKDLGAI